MNEIAIMPLVLLAGMGLGGVFFGGLWWTVKKGVLSTRPGLWFCVSLVVRSSIVLIGFYFIAGDHLERLLLCLLGFFLARLVVIRLTRIPEKSACPIEEPRHAPEP